MKVIRIHTEDGFRHGLLLDGETHSYFRVLLVDNPLRVQRLGQNEKRFVKELEDYPVARAIKILRRCAKNFHGGLRHCTKGVRIALKK